MKCQLFLASIAIAPIIAGYANAQQLSNSNPILHESPFDPNRSEMMPTPLTTCNKPIFQSSADSKDQQLLFSREPGKRKSSGRTSTKGSQQQPFPDVHVDPTTKTSPSTSQRSSAYRTAGTSSSSGRTSFFIAEGRQAKCDWVKGGCQNVLQAVKEKPELVASTLKTVGGVLGVEAAFRKFDPGTGYAAATIGCIGVVCGTGIEWYRAVQGMRAKNAHRSST